jgi:hypothetical protein
MVFAWFHEGPSGQRMDLFGFVALFFREALLLGFFLVVCVLICLAWLRRLFLRWRERRRSTPSGVSS